MHLKFFHSQKLFEFNGIFFSAGRVKIIKDIFRKNNSIADPELKAIVKITHVDRQNTDPAKQKVENIFIFG